MKRKKEIWKSVLGYEGIYEVSNIGRVRSLKRTILRKNLRPIPIKERLLSQGKSSGYFCVSLYKNATSKTLLVHAIMATAFLRHTACGTKMVCDHINNIKTDNRLKNIQIITNRENSTKDRIGGTSKYIGVSWDKGREKWVAKIQIKGSNEFLGRFTKELDADKAYQTALNSL